MNTGIELISEERIRQIEEEGFDESNDDEYTKGELAYAAACYAAMPLNIYKHIQVLDSHQFIGLWPWGKDWYKPTPENRIKELVKAGALIAAEIDRLQRVSDI